MNEADRFFGPGGLGLERRDSSPTTTAWQGGGTAVFLTTTPHEKGTRVEVASTEWDRQAQEFIQRLKRHIHL